MGSASVVIVGASFAGLQAGFSLRQKLGEKVRLVLVSDRLQFLYRPNTIYVPFGLSPARLLLQLTEPARRKGIELRLSRAVGIRVAERRLVTEEGEVPYDHLLLATGSLSDTASVPGMTEHARNIAERDGMLRLASDFEALAEDAARKRPRRVAFLLPEGNGWSGPLYEMTFLLDSWLRQLALRSAVELRLITHEKGCLEALGTDVAGIVAREFARQEVEVRTGARARRVTAQQIKLKGDQPVDADLVVTFPAHRGNSAGFEALARDERDFVRVDQSSREVEACEGIYAIGDVSDFPIKLGYLALLQAEAAAAHIAHRVDPQLPFEAFEPVALCVLEMGDTATFVRRSLVHAERADERVSETPLWKPAKKMLGLYLPHQFRHGEPFHEGLTWGLMEKTMGGIVRLLKGTRRT